MAMVVDGRHPAGRADGLRSSGGGPRPESLRAPPPGRERLQEVFGGVSRLSAPSPRLVSAMERQLEVLEEAERHPGALVRRCAARLAEVAEDAGCPEVASLGRIMAMQGEAHRVQAAARMARYALHQRVGSAPTLA